MQGNEGNAIPNKRDTTAVALKALEDGVTTHDEFFDQLAALGFELTTALHNRREFSNLALRLFGEKGSTLATAEELVKFIKSARESIQALQPEREIQWCIDAGGLVELPEDMKHTVYLARREADMRQIIRDATDDIVRGTPFESQALIGNESLRPFYPSTGEQAADDPRRAAMKEILFHCAAILLQRGYSFDEIW